jgi:two-component system LytT family sensor kinase
MSNYKSPVSRKVIYLIFFCLNTVASLFRYIIFEKNSWSFQIAMYVGAYVGFMITWELFLLTNKLLEKKYPLDKRPAVVVLLHLASTYLTIAILGTCLFALATYLFDAKLPDYINALSLLLFLLLSIIIHLIYIRSYYLDQWKNNLIHSERLQREHTQVKYDALRNQLNPHFLFNALTSLNSLIFENQQLASDFLKQLSKVYRYTLENKENETVSMKTELEFISHYIFLFKTRFDKAITFEINLNDEILERKIVPVTLQLLIENAVKHNIISDKLPLTISIEADMDYLIVANSVNKKTNVEESNKLGLSHLKALYKYISEKPVEITETAKLYTIKIPLIE